MIDYIILGLVQGITEFLPVSSSAHLLLAQNILGLRGEEIALSIVLHLGTLLAISLFFYQDILKCLRDKKTLFFICLVTLITGFIGLAGKDFFEQLFSRQGYLAASLIVTGIILLFTRFSLRGKREQANIKDGLILGIAQGVAIVPGISRSGLTISTLLFRGLNVNKSFSLSFIVSLPAILGAVILEARKIDFSLRANFTYLAAGFICSFISGMLALYGLKRIIQKAKFYYFGYYCLLLGLTVYFLTNFK